MAGLSAALRAAPQPFARGETKYLLNFIPLIRWKCTNNPRNNPLRYLNAARRKTPNPVKKFNALPLLASAPPTSNLLLSAASRCSTGVIMPQLSPATNGAPCAASGSGETAA